MDFSASYTAAIIALLVSCSATYNAYLLRGGKLAWVQVLTALATVCLMFSVIFEHFSLFQAKVLGWNSSELLLIAGLLFLFMASLRTHSSLK